MLTGLRYFERPIKADVGGLKPKDALSWGIVDKEALAKCLTLICQKILEIVSEEPRLLRVDSPAFILGMTVF